MIDNFCVPIGSGLTAVPEAGALSAARRTELLARLREFQRARALALAASRSYPITAAETGPQPEREIK